MVFLQVVKKPLPRHMPLMKVEAEQERLAYLVSLNSLSYRYTTGGTTGCVRTTQLPRCCPNPNSPRLHKFTQMFHEPSVL